MFIFKQTTRAPRMPEVQSEITKLRLFNNSLVMSLPHCYPDAARWIRNQIDVNRALITELLLVQMEQ